PTTAHVARRYGQIFAQQRRAGLPVPVNDMWIAAACIDCGGHLVTFDQDFARIAGLDRTVFASPPR
ncbi:MAG: PIN domain-containing protein, partial [Vicinamibacteria bacterium]